MKQAIIGLRKRETYEELINDLNHDPISNYPDRRAAELENSPYLSQLRAGFEEMMLQNDNLLKEKEKEVLLHKEAATSHIGRHEIAIHSDRWRHHVPPEPPEIFHTPERAPAPNPEPVGQPIILSPLRPEIQISETRTRSARKPRDRNQPIIQEPEPMIEEILPPEYNIGTPLNTPVPKRGRGRPKKVPVAHDVDPHVQEAYDTAIDVSELARKRDKMKTESTLDFFSLMLEEAARNPNLDEFMTGQGEKRREEGANPAPPKPKAKTAKPQREALGDEPSNTGARASTDIPQAKAKASPKKEAKASPKKEAKPEEPKTKTKPVKKDIPHKNPIEQKGNTPLIYSDLQEHLNNMKGMCNKGTSST